MRVDDIMNKHVQTCRPDDSLELAAQIMWDHECGCLPVCSGDGITRTIGMITDRDICMGALFQGKPLQKMRSRPSFASTSASWQSGCWPRHTGHAASYRI